MSCHLNSADRFARLRDKKFRHDRSGSESPARDAGHLSSWRRLAILFFGECFPRGSISLPTPTQRLQTEVTLLPSEEDLISSVPSAAAMVLPSSNSRNGTRHG